MPRQGANGQQLYSYSELINSSDSGQQTRDAQRIAWLTNPQTKAQDIKKEIKSGHLDARILLRLVHQEPKVRILFSNKEFDDVLKERLKHNSGYFDFPLEHTTLFDIWLGLEIFEHYKRYKNEEMENDPHAIELLNEACNRNILAAIQWRCMDAVNSLNSDQASNITLNLEYAEQIAKKFYALGNLEAARLCFRMGEYLDRKISVLKSPSFFLIKHGKTSEIMQQNICGITIKCIFMKGLEYLSTAQNLFQSTESQKAFEIAFGKNNSLETIFKHYKLPETVRDFSSAIEFFRSNYEKYVGKNNSNCFDLLATFNQSSSPAA